MAPPRKSHRLRRVCVRWISRKLDQRSIWHVSFRGFSQWEAGGDTRAAFLIGAR